MAILGALMALYITNEVSDMIIDFNYTEYFQTKLKNTNKRVQIDMLELEYNSAKSMYNQYNNQYKHCIVSGDRTNFDNIKKQRLHYYNLMKQSMDYISKLKREIKS